MEDSSPSTVMEVADLVLQVFEVYEAVEETKEVIVTTIEEDSNTNSTPVASCGPGTKPSQVIQYVELCVGRNQLWAFQSAALLLNVGGVTDVNATSLSLTSEMYDFLVSLFILIYSNTQCSSWDTLQQSEAGDALKFS